MLSQSSDTDIGIVAQYSVNVRFGSDAGPSNVVPSEKRSVGLAEGVPIEASRDHSPWARRCGLSPDWTSVRFTAGSRHLTVFRIRSRSTLFT
jgi:hypothetical protein